MCSDMGSIKFQNWNCLFKTIGIEKKLELKFAPKTKLKRQN